MEKYLVGVFLLISSIATMAGDYYDGTIVFADGQSICGLVDSSLGTDYVTFKGWENASEEKIESSKVKKIILEINGEIAEYHLVKVQLGWGWKGVSDPIWLKVVEKGTATLYVNSVTMTGRDGQNSTGFLDYFVIRNGEPAAKMIANVSTVNNNQTFRTTAPLYFEDYPELAAKIKSKQYTWKDLTIVIQEYNRWTGVR